MVASANEQQAQARVGADLEALLTYSKAMQERQVREARASVGRMSIVGIFP